MKYAILAAVLSALWIFMYIAIKACGVFYYFAKKLKL